MSDRMDLNIEYRAACAGCGLTHRALPRCVECKAPTCISCKSRCGMRTSDVYTWPTCKACVRGVKKKPLLVCEDARVWPLEHMERKHTHDLSYLEKMNELYGL